MTPVLEVKALTILRNGTRILNEVDWTVNRGEHWVILGANGSGKTSLLSALTGYLTPSSGSVSVLGETFGETDWRELRKRIGIVSSAIRQKIPDWDPVELVVIGGKFAMLDYWGRVTKADRQRAAAMMELSECLQLKGREWGVLSQGERQRVLIARALMANPDVLILDEPCAGLDPVARERFLDFVERQLTTGNSPTLLFVTHHIEEITQSLTHSLLLKAGSVVADGPIPETLVSSIVNQVFSADLSIRKTKGRYTLKIRNL
jgi:iron complex transport system ATP-binding protein